MKHKSSFHFPCVFQLKGPPNAVKCRRSSVFDEFTSTLPRFRCQVGLQAFGVLAERLRGRSGTFPAMKDICFSFFKRKSRLKGEENEKLKNTMPHGRASRFARAPSCDWKGAMVAVSVGTLGQIRERQFQFLLQFRFDGEPIHPD